MNILFVEDNEENLKNFTRQLQTLGTVYAFKSSNGSRKFIADGKVTIDLIVCDHNILRFEEDSGRYMAEGNEVYEEVRDFRDLKIPFIHFSAEPCPDKYHGSNEDTQFYSMKKEYSVDLVKFINEKVLK